MTKEEFKKSRYLEILIPDIKISKTSGCLAVFIPSKIAKKHGIEHKDKVIPTLFINNEETHSEHQQIALPLIKISKTAGSLVLFIPANIAKKYEVKQNDKCMLIIIKRKFKIRGDMTLNEIIKLIKNTSGAEDEKRAMNKALRELEALS